MTHEEKKAKQREYSRAYRAAHREEVLAYQRAWHAAHREAQQIYRAERREERRVKHAAYYAAHREERRAYNDAHREERQAYQRARNAACREDLSARDQANTRIRGWAKWFDGCSHCGCRIDPAALDLHHRNPAEKEVGLSAANGWKRWFAEYLKCDVLCANCHRIVHAEERSN
ncbi:MAG: hypothetical protein WC683_07045 [bacterium]